MFTRDKSSYREQKLLIRSRGPTLQATAFQRQSALPGSPPWPPHVVDHDGGLAAIGEAPATAGDSPHPSAFEIPRDVAPVRASRHRHRSRPCRHAATCPARTVGHARAVRARSGPRRRGEGSLLDSPDGRTERDQAGRVHGDVRHGVARAASHRQAPAGSRSGAVVSPSRSRLSSSISSFPRGGARGAAAASFTPPPPRPPRVGDLCNPCLSSRGGHATDAPGCLVYENLAGGYEGEPPVLLGCPLAGPVPGLGSPPGRRRTRSADR